MPTLTGAVPSFSLGIKAVSQYGALHRAFWDRIGATTTAATATSGAVSTQRFPKSLTLPAVASGLEGFALTAADMQQEDAVMLAQASLEYNLGVLTVSGNSFADGVTMPMKKIFGQNVQTGSQVAFVVVTATLTATTPVLTITYKNQAGTASRTAEMTLPTNALVNSAFLINPHLQSGDTGIRDITGVSISTGSAGSLAVMGCLPIGESCAASSSTVFNNSIEPLVTTRPLYCAVPGDVVAFYRYGGTSTCDILANISGVPEVS